MYCKKCGAKNPDDASFCEECGKETKVVTEHQPMLQQTPDVVPQNTPKKNNTMTIIAIVAVVLAVSLALCIGVLLGKSDKDSESNTVKGEVAEATPQPDEQKPTAEPTKEPTKEPTMEPTQEPTKEPTQEPTKEPVKEPVQVPQQQVEMQQEGHEMGIAPSDPSNGEPAEILQIREWFQDTENNAQKSSQSSGVTCYHKNGELVKIRIDAGYALSVYDDFLTYNNREYFYKDNQLYFVNILTANPAGDRFYYVNGNVVRYSEANDKKHYYNGDISPYVGLGYSCRTEGEELFWANIAR